MNLKGPEGQFMEKIGRASIDRCYAVSDSIIGEISRVLIGKKDKIVSVLTCFYAGGHILIEDVPGVGKTTLAVSLSKAVGLKCNRAQFTPDVTASDITGFNIYNRKTDSFEYKEGLAMCNVLLADEINRTSPKTQSSLLEAMEEHKVTVDGVVYPLPDPFMVIATQNPSGFVGTYPLPEAQLDRFLMRLSIGYPDTSSEISLLKDRQTENPLDTVEPVASRDDIADIRSYCSEVFVSDTVYSYIVELISKTRTNKYLELGASPRASLALMKAAQATAFLKKRNYVLPEDVNRVFVNVISHRIAVKQEYRYEFSGTEKIAGDILSSVETPYVSKN